MCELLGFSGNQILDMTPKLKILMAHSHEHPHGWGLATFSGAFVNLEKEPKSAWISDYLNSRLGTPVKTTGLIAHIRLATKGNMSYENSHPFVKSDDSGRVWTLAHNGTIFDSPRLDRYCEEQTGATDSERILCHLIHEINQAQAGRTEPLSSEERFAVVDRAVLSIAEHNKVNLLIYDGELLYVHTNMAKTLYYSNIPEGVVIATVPQDDGARWQSVPMMQLLAFKDGVQIFAGTSHGFEYRLDADPDVSMSWLGL